MYDILITYVHECMLCMNHLRPLSFQFYFFFFFFCVEGIKILIFLNLLIYDAKLP